MNTIAQTPMVLPKLLKKTASSLLQFDQNSILLIHLFKG